MYLIAADGTISWAKLCPGTWHDGKAYTTLNMWLTQNCPEPYNILGDSAFPASEYLLRPLTAVQIGGRVRRADPGEDADALADKLNDYNRRVSRLRIAAEWGVLDMKRFSPFRGPMSADPGRAELAWMVCLSWHNFLARCEGKSQTATVFAKKEFAPPFDVVPQE